MYAMIYTRPDISIAVGKLSQYLNDPGLDRWNAAKRVLRYLKGTTTFGVDLSGGHLQVIGFADADWGGDVDERKSTLEYLFMLGGGAVAWASSRQRTVALPTTEVEYMALCHASREYVWIRSFCKELSIPIRNYQLNNDN
ncbi:hypothetical protein O6H91_07G108100 [Diphasiastrum complanatum]|uniref:Uncharacterized protein n=1 Tax=Diphasiastrum complanatum TaxID=34168 RepID=A0ACC2D9E7_DIPCM|nr:hypothetical protein O6H91_07G108100 [Diphasiastrum complanatum]